MKSSLVDSRTRVVVPAQVINRGCSSAEPLAASFLEPLDHFAELWIVRAFVVVPEAFFGVAAGARDREVFEIIGAAMVLRHDVLERRAVDRGAIGSKHELALAVDALAFEHLLTVELPWLECPIRGGYFQQPPLLPA